MTSIVITRNAKIRVFRCEAKSKKDVHDDIVQFQNTFNEAPTDETIVNFFKELGYSQEHALGVTIT